jgi:hypothetical protein
MKFNQLLSLIFALAALGLTSQLANADPTPTPTPTPTTTTEATPTPAPDPYTESIFSSGDMKVTLNPADGTYKIVKKKPPCASVNPSPDGCKADEPFEQSPITGLDNLQAAVEELKMGHNIAVAAEISAELRNRKKQIASLDAQYGPTLALCASKGGSCGNFAAILAKTKSGLTQEINNLNDSLSRALAGDTFQKDVKCTTVSQAMLTMSSVQSNLCQASGPNDLTTPKTLCLQKANCSLQGSNDISGLPSFSWESDLICGCGLTADQCQYASGSFTTSPSMAFGDQGLLNKINNGSNGSGSTQ